MSYDHRTATTRQMRELAEKFLQLEGLPPNKVRKWTEDMAKALGMAIVDNRYVSGVLHHIALEEIDEERHGRH